MRIAVTGTPGTGKTTAVETLETDLEVVHLNDVISEEGLTTGVDEARDSEIVDLPAVRERFADADDVIIESHLAHRLPADRVIVLRCRPETIVDRLVSRGEPESTAAENAESEALDVVLSAAVAEHGLDRVYEIDTTDREPDDVATEIGRVISGDREPSAGTVSFEDYL